MTILYHLCVSVSSESRRGLCTVTAAVVPTLFGYAVHQDVGTPHRILCLGLLDDHVRLMFHRQGAIRRSIIPRGTLLHDG